MIRILGAKGIIQDVGGLLKETLAFSKKHRVTIQVMNADVVFGKTHLLSAAEHAIRSMKRKTNTTKTLAMEVLLYASGERQIKLSIEKLGVKRGKGNIAVVCIDGIKEFSEARGNVTHQSIADLLKTVDLTRDDMVLEGTKNTLKKFGLSDAEINTVTEAKYGQLILEKVAMVDVIK